MRYPIVLTPDDGTLLATCPDLPEVASFGATVEEALAHAADAVATALRGRIVAREPVPAPSHAGDHHVTLSALTRLKLELQRAMVEGDVRKAELARRLGVHPPQIDRLLDLDHESRLDQIERALHALGREIHLETRAAA